MVLAERYASWENETRALCEVGANGTRLIQDLYSEGREATLLDPRSPQSEGLRECLRGRVSYWASRDLRARAQAWTTEIAAAIMSARRSSDRLGLFREWAWLHHSTLPLLVQLLPGSEAQPALRALAEEAQAAWRALPSRGAPAFHRVHSYQGSAAFVARQGKQLFGAVYRLDRGTGAPSLHAEVVETWALDAEQITLCVPISIGCPNRCPMCEFGTYWGGDLSAVEIQRLVELNLAQDRGTPIEVRPDHLTIYYLGGGDPSLHGEVPALLQGVAQAFPGVRQVLSTIAIDGGQGISALAEVAGRTPGVGLQLSLCSLDEDERRAWTGGVRLVPREAALRSLARFTELSGKKGYVSLFLGREQSPEALVEQAQRHLDRSAVHLTLTVVRENGLSASRWGSHGVEYERALELLGRAGFECSLSTNDADPDNQVACGRSDPLQHLGNHRFRKVAS